MGNVLKRIDLSTADKIGKGGYSDIFLFENKVYKLFISDSHPRRSEQPLGYEFIEKVFLDEVKAYSIAMKDEITGGMVPHFYGTTDVTNVENPDSYHLNFCYTIEFINGKCGKLANYLDKSYLSEAVEHLKIIGINYTIDAGVFNPDSPSKFRIFDFGTREFIPVVLE